MSLSISSMIIPTEPDIESVTRTLSTPELLEMILLHLPIRSLIRAQQVSSEWRNGFSASKTLHERTLFLRPSPSKGSIPSGEKITTFNPTILSSPTRTALSIATKLARKVVPKDFAPFGAIPFCPLELLRRPKGPWMNQLICDPPSDKTIVTTVWNSEVVFFPENSGLAPRFQRMGPSKGTQVTFAGVTTWYDVRRYLYEEVYGAREQKRAIVGRVGNKVCWEIGKVAWLRLDGMVLDTDERVVRDKGLLLA